MHEVTVTIEPSEKYWRVIDPVERVHGENTDHEDWSDEEKEAAEAYLETVADTPELEDQSVYEESALSWNDFSVSKDPDLVSKMATYFDGMSPDESTGLLRAKLRLLDCEVYANAQIASRAELREPMKSYEVYLQYEDEAYGQGLDEATEDDEYFSIVAKGREEAAELAKLQSGFPVDCVTSVCLE